MKRTFAAFVLVLGCKAAAPTVDGDAPGMCASATPCASSGAGDEKPKALETTCAQLRAGAKGTVGRALKESSLYGTAVAFTRDVYYGRVGKASEIELLEHDPIVEEKYKTLWIKVRVVCVIADRPDDTQGRVGWVEMTDTSFSDHYNPATKKIEQ
jgi:hypothetical protein